METVATPAEPAAAELPPYNDPDVFAVTAQGQDLTFYPAGKDRLERLVRLIDEAESSLRLAFYIYAPDNSGIRVRDALVRAARRGVDVSLLVDGFGATAPAEFFAELVEAGGTFCSFQPHWSVRYLIRNHQKIAVADKRVAMLGGFNVSDEYFAPPDHNGWHDLGFTVEGSLVAKVVEWYDRLERWTLDPHAKFRSIRRMVRTWDGGEDPVRLLIGGPTRWFSSWARCVSLEMKEARRLDLIMAYFAPPYSLLRRIRRIARKGEARLVMAGKSDNAATVGAARSLYGFLLSARAQVWEFQPCKLHTKLIVLDDSVYVGSANFDMRSLYINLEIMVKIEDKTLAERMRDFVAAHEEASIDVTPQVYRQWATPLNRLRWWASWFLVSVVDYTVSRRLNLGL
jgi:cardiolipin synthase